MRVDEVMTRGVECTSPAVTLYDAAKRMKALDVGSLPVCDSDRLVGMLTDRDITVRSVSEGRDPRTQQVREVMSPEVFYCFEDQDVKEAVEVMRTKQVRRLPVLSRDKRLTGIVSIGDLAVEAGDDKLVGQTLEDISEPAKAAR